MAGDRALAWVKRIEIDRPLFFHILLRPGFYASALATILLLGAYLLYASGTARDVSAVSSGDIRIRSIVYAAVIAPAVETLIVAMLFLPFKRLRLGQSRVAYLFSTAIMIVAWFAHGASLPAIFPAIMFFASSLYYSRTISLYDRRTEEAYAGALLIHFVYNLPHVVVSLMRI